MKKAIIPCAVALLFLAGCKCQQPVENFDSRHEYVSWISFCAERGYNVDDCTHEALSDYLDTWRGSVSEEQAFIKAGLPLE